MKEGLSGILKFFVFLLFLPAVIAIAISFQNNILGLPVYKERFFLWGVAAFILVYLFLYNFKHVYDFGHMAVANLFQGIGPSSHAVAFALPVYTLFIVCIYFVLKLVHQSAQYEGIVFVALGFTATMHIILTAHQLYEADNNPLKSQYLLLFGLALIVNLIIISLLLWIVVPEMSFTVFFRGFWDRMVDYYQMIYKALFISPS